MTEQIFYKYGFEYFGILYAWKDKKLYKLPYYKNKRSYALKEVPFYKFKTTLVCNIQRRKLTLNRIKKMTVEINYSLDTIVKDKLPF